MRVYSFSFLTIFLGLTLLLGSCQYKADGDNNLFFENLEFNSPDSIAYYDGEKYTGPVARYYKNGELEFRGSYKDGVKFGDWEYYLDDGNLSREEFGQPESGKEFKIKKYRNRTGRLYWELRGIGQDTIHYIKYHHNGRIGQELINEGIRMFRKWTSKGTLYHYYNEDSVVVVLNTKTKEIIHKGFFKNGKRNGFWFKKTKDGTLLYERNYKLGKLVGKYVDYYQNGNKEVEKTYNHNGFPQGKIRKYHQGGPLHVEGQFNKNGKKEGTWKTYTQYGDTWAIENYNAGYLHGYAEYHNSRGNLTSKGYYKFNRKVGDWYYYDKRGRLKEKVKESRDSYSDEST